MVAVQGADPETIGDFGLGNTRGNRQAREEGRVRPLEFFDRFLERLVTPQEQHAGNVVFGVSGPKDLAATADLDLRREGSDGGGFRAGRFQGLADASHLIAETGVPVEFHDRLFVFPDQPNRGPTYWDWTLTPVKDGTGTVVGLVFSLVDTTARKQVEANLQASKERFELAVRGSGVGIWDWDIRTGKVYYSPRWKRLFGYEEDEIGDGFEDWARLLHPDEGESIIKFQEDFLKGTSPSVAAEYRLRHKDGSYRWIEAHGVVVRDGEGKACRLVGSHGDITARKQAEEDLKTLNETLELRVAERTEAIQLLHSIASMANQVQNAGQAIEFCLQRLAMYNGWNFGHALLPAADNPGELVPRYVRYPQDSDRFHRFREVTLGMRFRRGEDLPGRAFASGQPEWATDLRQDLVACRAAVAEELGLVTAIALPILVGEKVAGVLELFSNGVIQPDRRTTDTMVGVGLQLGRVLERASFEEHLLTIAEEIRQGMAQDLHDDVGQELTGLGLKMETLAEMLASTKSPARTLAADIAVALDRTRGKVRKLSRGLLPVELEVGLLASALGQLAATATAGSAIACTFDCFHPDPVFNRRVAMHLYRIAQEAVSNAVRHSGASGIQITLDQENGEISLSIEDDGAGLPCKAPQAEGMGLRTMQYRAALIGGKLEVGPASHGGTQVVCRLIPQRLV